MRKFRRVPPLFLRNREPFLGRTKTKSVGYALTGLKDHSEHEQLLALKNCGCSQIFQEAISVRTLQIQRPQFQAALKALGCGDELVVLNVFCLAGSVEEILGLIKNLYEKGISLRTIDGAVNTRLLQDEGLALIGILSSLLEAERSLIQERKYERFQERNKDGVNIGGRPKTNPIKENLVLRLRREGCSYRSIRAQTGLALSTIRRIIMENEALAA